MSIKRFRKEVRERTDIVPFATIALNDAPERQINTRAATLLLKDIFADRITITQSPNGVLCGSREEAGANRLAAYTANQPAHDVLLSSLTAKEIETYLEGKTGESHTVFIPDTPEVRLIRQLGNDFPDVLHGI